MTKVSEQAGLVVGLTNASADVLSKMPDVPLLIPGLGAQGGDAWDGRGRHRAAAGRKASEPAISFSAVWTTSRKANA